MTFRSRPALVLLCGCLLAALCAGCSPVITKTRPTTVTYALEYPPPPAGPPATDRVLRVLHFTAAPPYADEAMTYKDGANRRLTYPYHRWLASPPAMVQAMLARDLAASGVAAGVVGPAAPAAAGWALGGTVEAFYEDETEAVWRAHLAVTILLLDQRAPARVVAQRTYEESEPLERHHPQALAAAMSRAVARLSARVVADLRRDLAAAEEKEEGGKDSF